MKLCHCKVWAPLLTTPFVVDGVPVCDMTCMQHIDAAIIEEQIAFRESNGIEALRAREQSKTSRVVVCRSNHCELGESDVEQVSALQ